MSAPTNAVQARFHLRSIERYPGNPGGKVVLSAVSRGDRNATWAAATPSGELTMQVNNPEGFAWFQSLLDAVDTGEIRYPEVDIVMTVSNLAVPGDGHPFRVAVVPDGHYMTGKCGECGLEQKHHTST
jgi:hypothetical protein